MWHQFMPMEFLTTPIKDLIVMKPKRFEDSRGYFMETYRKDLLTPYVGDVAFVQDNESRSVRGVLRGLHLQTGEHAQAKLIRVTTGTVFDVAVDLRANSKTFGQWYGIELSEDNALMMFVPRGFAHGFIVLSDIAKFNYKVDNYYAPQSEITIAYNDPELNIAWPDAGINNILSRRDSEHAISFDDFKKLYNI